MAEPILVVPYDPQVYAQLKYALAARHRDQRALYVEAKSPMIWTILAKANAWSQRIGWQPGPTDV